MEKSIRFGIVGLGFISPKHIEAMKKFGKIVWACDIDASKYDSRHFPVETKFTTDYKNIGGVDYVAICAPNHLHYKMMKHFLAKGIRVIVEKPPVLSYKEYEDLKDNDKINVVLQLRYHPEIVRLKQEVKSGHDVRLEVVVKRDQSYWDGWKGDEKRSGGIVVNLGVHYLDILLYLFGDMSAGLYDVGTKQAIISLKLEKADARAFFQIKDTAEGQTRKITIDGKEIQLSTKDNLSFENLHEKVYEEALSGRGIKLKECEPVLRLLDRIKR